MDGAIGVGECPVFSPQIAAGSTTSASSAVSVRNVSCDDDEQPFRVEIDRMRASSGSDTAGFVPLIQRKPIEPSSA